MVGIRSVIFIVLSCITCTVYSQKKKDFAIERAKVFRLEMGNLIKASTAKMPFKSIRVIDYRYDTSKLGYVEQAGLQKIKLEMDGSVGITEFLNRYFKNNLDVDSKLSLLVIIKSLWLSQGIRDSTLKKSLQNAGNARKGDDDYLWWYRAGTCYADLEVFASDGEKYKAVCKIQGEFKHRNYSYQNLKEFLILPFDSLFKKIMTLDMGHHLMDKREFTLQQIFENYKKRFDIPILRADSSSKGIFLSFNDFKDNRLSHPNFTIRKGKLTDQLYSDSDGKGELVLNCWGYLDGENYYIKVGFNFFKLIRQNNTWDFYGGHLYATGGQDNQYSEYGSFRTYNSSTGVAYQALQINMETGKSY